MWYLFLGENIMLLLCYQSVMIKKSISFKNFSYFAKICMRVYEFRRDSFFAGLGEILKDQMVTVKLTILKVL